MWARRASRSGADDGTRTRNRRFTKPLLYQLSYVGANGKPKPAGAPANDRPARRRRSSARRSGLLREKRRTLLDIVERRWFRRRRGPAPRGGLRLRGGGRLRCVGWLRGGGRLRRVP